MADGIWHTELHENQDLLQPARELTVYSAEARLGAEQYLREWGGELFPPWLEGTIHPLMTSVLPLDVDARLVHLQAVFPDLLTSLGEHC